MHFLERFYRLSNSFSRAAGIFRISTALANKSKNTKATAPAAMAATATNTIMLQQMSNASIKAEVKKAT